MKKAELLQRIQAERATYDELLASIDPGRMSEQGLDGEWSVKDVKDVVAHVAWYEREMIGPIKARALIGSDMWDLDLDERNEAILEENHKRSAEEILAESRQVYSELLSQLATLDDEDLLDPGRFAGMPQEWIPWQVIASNTYEHYPEHVAQIKAWLDKGAGG